VHSARAALDSIARCSPRASISTKLSPSVLSTSQQLLALARSLNTLTMRLNNEVLSSA